MKHMNFKKQSPKFKRNFQKFPEQDFPTCGRIPVWVKNDDPICSDEIDAQSTHFRRQQEEEQRLVLRVYIQKCDGRFSIIYIRQ